VKYVCDIEESVLASRAAGIEKRTGKKPIAIKDYRTALDDKSLDALVGGTPDHWRALPPQPVHRRRSALQPNVAAAATLGILKRRFSPTSRRLRPLGSGQNPCGVRGCF
jgi:hypothetical protein